MAMHNRSQRFQPHLQLRPVALALVCMGLAPALAQTLPTGFSAIAGGVTAATPNAATTVSYTHLTLPTNREV